MTREEFWQKWVAESDLPVTDKDEMFDDLIEVATDIFQQVVRFHCGKGELDKDVEAHIVKEMDK